jgi:hypothetical protein
MILVALSCKAPMLATYNDLGLQRGMASEHFTYFAGQRFGRERLLQKCQAGFENPVVDDGVIGIA